MKFKPGQKVKYCAIWDNCIGCSWETVYPAFAISEIELPIDSVTTLPDGTLYIERNFDHGKKEAPKVYEKPYDGVWHRHVFNRALDSVGIIKTYWQELNYQMQRARNGNKQRQAEFDAASRILLR